MSLLFHGRWTRVRPEKEQTYFNADLSSLGTAQLKRHRRGFSFPVDPAGSVCHRQRADSCQGKNGYREKLVARASDFLQRMGETFKAELAFQVADVDDGAIRWVHPTQVTHVLHGLDGIGQEGWDGFED